jgi:hypothetical protein
MASRRELNIHMSFTEMPQFRRLVEFIDEVEDYARLTADEDLSDRVRHLRAELLEMRR